MNLLQEKLVKYDIPQQAKAAGVYPYFRAISSEQDCEVIINGKKVLMFGSNSYLGLTNHPKIKEAAIEAVRKYGTGCAGSRFLNGTLDIHEQLEERLAKFVGKDEAIIFSTGFQVNLGVVSCLTSREDYLILDECDHASIIEGRRLSFSNTLKYKHNDMEDLEKVLQNIPEKAAKLVVTDGVFSVTGEIVNLPDMVKVAHKYGAKVLVDDAHSVGVIGKGGRGTASHYDLEKETDMIMGTFSKTFASLGGFVAGPERVINYLKHISPAIIFSASPTPASCASALAALDVLEQHPELVDNLLSNARYASEGFIKKGFTVMPSQTGIVPVIVGDEERAFITWRKLFDRGVFVNAFIPPGVPPNMSMMRTSYMATHKKEHLDEIIHHFGEVGKEIGMLS